MSYIEKYKKGLAVFVGTICLFIALFLPAKYAMGMEVRCLGEEVWTSINWIFLALAIVFLWGEIVSLAKSVQGALSKKIN